MFHPKEESSDAPWGLSAQPHPQGYPDGALLPARSQSLVQLPWHPWDTPTGYKGKN